MSNGQQSDVGDRHCGAHSGMVSEIANSKNDISSINRAIVDMWATIHKKLPKASFHWFMGIMIPILIVMVAALFGEIRSVNAKVDRIQISTIEVKTKLEERSKIEKEILRLQLEGKK